MTLPHLYPIYPIYIPITPTNLSLSQHVSWTHVIHMTTSLLSCLMGFSTVTQYRMRNVAAKHYSSSPSKKTGHPWSLPYLQIYIHSVRKPHWCHRESRLGHSSPHPTTTVVACATSEHRRSLSAGPPAPTPKLLQPTCCKVGGVIF